MIDEKIPADMRDQVALLADGDHIMWVIGWRISSYYKIGPDTKRVLQVKIKKEEQYRPGEVCLRRFILRNGG